MFHRILVPLDGSERAERALPVAARLAHASHGTLIVVQVLNTDTTPYVVPGMMLSDTMVQAESDEADHYLTQITASFKQEGLPVEQVAMFGIPAFLLLSTIESSHADLVVMCSHGRTGFTRWALGSVAEKIARSSSVPVLVLREHSPILTGSHSDPTQPLCVLVPLDGSTAAKTAIEPAAHLITALTSHGRGALHLTRIVQPIEGDHRIMHYQLSLDDLVHQAKHSLRNTLNNVRDGFEASSVAPLGLDISCSVASDPDVAQAIIRIAEHGEDAESAGSSGGYDVIAMATHGRTGLDHLALGSITERVLHATHLPILIVRIPHKAVQNTTGEEHQTEAEKISLLARYETSEVK